jgi:D-alanyl-D-alanine carboxypeptidase (penicillin-binding protein 5/6)
MRTTIHSKILSIVKGLFERNRVVYLSCLFVWSCVIAQNDNPLGIEIESGSAYMIEVSSGRVLYSKNPHRSIYPASTTKLATVLLSYSKLSSRLEEKVVIQKEMIGAISHEKKVASNYTFPAYWLETNSSNMGLRLGEEMCLEDLFKGALVVSANDACNALALTTSGSYEKFMQEMNEMASHLGCKNTYFVNPHGLYQPTQKSSVYDLVQIAKEVIKYPFLTKITAQSTYKRPATNKKGSVFLASTNKLLHKGKFYCIGACGLKTGFTQQSGASFVAYAKNDHREILLAISNNPKRAAVFEEAKAILTLALNEPKQEQFFYAAGTKLAQTRQVPWTKGRLQVLAKDQVKTEVYASENETFNGVISWLDLVPPIKKGHYVGRLDIRNAQGKVVSSTALIAANDLEPSYLFHLMHCIYSAPFISVGIGIFVIIFVVIAGVIWRKKSY